RLEREAAFGGEAAAHKRVEGPVERLGGRRREEADGAEVHAEDGGGAAVEGARPAQQRAIAAEGDKAVETGGARQRRRRGLRPQRCDPVFGEEAESQARRDLREMREQIAPRLG